MMVGDMEAQWWKSGEVAEGFGDAGAGQENRKKVEELTTKLTNHSNLMDRW